jgi:hypothetical protein
MIRAIFVDSFLPENNGQKVDLYNKDEVLTRATDENISDLKEVEALDDDKVVGYMLIDGDYVQIYNMEVIRVVD